MEDILAMIDDLMLEHEGLITNLQALEHMATDFGAAFQLEQAKEALVIGRLTGQEEGLNRMEAALAQAEAKLQAHFNREERGLLGAFEQSGNRMFASALHELLPEHTELLNRLTNSKQVIGELRSSGLSRDVWEGKAWGIRAYITHTRRLLEDHAHAEYALLWKARRELTAPKEK